jgi:hypothetical protein
MAVAQNQLELAGDYFVEGIQEVRAVGVQRQIIYGLSMLGYTRLRQGDASEALTPLLEGLQMARRNGMPRYICTLQRNLAYAYLALKNDEATRSALFESLTTARELDINPELAKSLACAVAYALHLGLSEQAAVWAGALVGSPYLDEALFALTCHKLEVALTTERYQEAFERGKVLKLEHIALEILTLLGEGAPSENG